MPLILQPPQVKIMTTHAEKAYPEECCGLLLGVQDEDRDHRIVHEIQPMTNDWTEAVNPFADGDSPQSVSKANRFWIDPKALMEAQRYGRDRGWIILSVYHSHPDHPSVPSERDRELAWSGYSYPILSVIEGKLASIQSWRLTDKEIFGEEAIVVE